MYEFRYVKGHIEVYLDGKFQFSADTMKEAREELENEWNVHFDEIEAEVDDVQYEFDEEKFKELIGF